MRSAGDVGSDITQRFELVFVLQVNFRRYQGSLNTLPGSASSHSGAAKAPVYLVIPGEALCGGEPSLVTQKLCRISRSSRTFVPWKAIEFNSKSQVQTAQDKPELAKSENDPEHICPPCHQYTSYVSAGHALDWRSRMRCYMVHRL